MNQTRKVHGTFVSLPNCTASTGLVGAAMHLFVHSSLHTNIRTVNQHSRGQYTVGFTNF